MLAFQVSINSQPLYTVGIGDSGMLNAGLAWTRIAQNNGNIYEHLWVESRAMDVATKTHHHWQNAALKVGDEVTIKVVRIDSVDPPLSDFPSGESSN